jgi:hypothetical protein
MRAVYSVASNPVCPNEEAAKQAVNEVWDSCFNDTRPFDEVSSTLFSPIVLRRESAAHPVTRYIKILFWGFEFLVQFSFSNSITTPLVCGAVSLRPGHAAMRSPLVLLITIIAIVVEMTSSIDC